MAAISSSVFLPPVGSVLIAAADDFPSLFQGFA